MLGGTLRPELCRALRVPRSLGNVLLEWEPLRFVSRGVIQFVCIQYIIYIFSYV